jgi:hypothetical protein
VKRKPVGGSEVVLVESADVPRHMVGDDTAIYWAERGGVGLANGTINRTAK